MSRKLLGGGGGGSAPQINDSRIIVHSFAAPPAPRTNLIPVYDTSIADNQVIQARIKLPANGLI